MPKQLIYVNANYCSKLAFGKKPQSIEITMFSEIYFKIIIYSIAFNANL